MKIINLYQAILSLKTNQETRNFFRDLLTIEEIKELSLRWQAAQLLSANYSYTEITKRTKLSSRTIARISRWLNRGRGGYKLIVRRQHQQQVHSSSPGDSLA
jgi:TrpR-related protein YerC/YecD